MCGIIGFNFKCKNENILNKNNDEDNWEFLINKFLSYKDTKTSH